MSVDPTPPTSKIPQWFSNTLFILMLLAIAGLAFWLNQNKPQPTAPQTIPVQPGIRSQPHSSPPARTRQR